MGMTFLIWFSLLLFTPLFSTELLNYELTAKDQKSKIFETTFLPQKPFNEIIISWNAQRPVLDPYRIQVSVFVNEWSPWVDYSYWGKDDQHSFKINSPLLNISQDVLTITSPTKATQLKVRVLSENLENFYRLYISSLDTDTHELALGILTEEKSHVKIKGLSQMALPIPHYNRICSPASLAAVVGHCKKSFVSPIEFSARVRDMAFDIYGNWNLNTAQASHELGIGWKCYVTRFTSFDQVTNHLRKNLPLVTSIRGPIPGGALPYIGGHLLVVKGYDPVTKKVLCMDPAFPTDELTDVSYELNDFLKAWSERQGLVYIVEPI